MVHNAWKIISKSPNKKEVDWLLKLLLVNRGLNTKSKQEKFLNPKLEDILEEKITDIKKAISRIEKAIFNKEKIIVYSDYDADGICATAIAWETLNDLGANVMPYVPHRIKEGYGLSNEAITQLKKEGASLILTVDHGVTAKDQVEFAKKIGVDVIITDHHVLPKVLPKAEAIVHTTKMCGAGVAWLFCYHLIQKLKPTYAEKLFSKLELAALATIADLVPLLGANRAIVKIGLEKIKKTKRLGLIALIKACRIEGSVGTYEIGHLIAPRINAMGRLEHGLDSLRLLCAKNESSAQQLTRLLVQTNSRRQDLTVKAIETAKELVNEEHEIGVISHHSLHEGVIGLVASRLVESFNRPMIIIAKGEKISKGSARSVIGFNIIEAIRSSSEFLIDGGGHPMAAGFSIKTEYIEAFSKKINNYAASKLQNKNTNSTIQIECELDSQDINQKTLNIINTLEPYGQGNTQPVFLTRRMLLEESRTVGAENKHLKLQLSNFGAIAFNMGDQNAKIRPGYLLDVVYQLSINRYNNNFSIQLKIKDFRIKS